ncbi:BON domain-containing protein [Paraburkholderia sp. RL18-103-BIB-C]|jgi:osmotically-inducible protein OsmY|uniref:BON domain-containing protein n=1 Tax=unclassified Paraburkholderia TaxID=2615204 RepID=UPI0038B9DA6C
MKALKALKLAGGTLIAVTSIGAWCQASDTGMAPAQSTMAPSGGGMSTSNKQADRALSKKVRAALVKNKDLTATNIHVRATSGAVVLEGTVPDAAQSDKATAAAKGVPGVMSVKNDLSIKEEGQ